MLFIGRCLAWSRRQCRAAPDPGGSCTRILVWLGGPMTAVTCATNSRPACGRHTIRPGLLPGEDADAGQGMSGHSVSCSRRGLAVTGEIDESGFCFFAQALDGLAEGSLVHVDLAGVECCDVAGLRLMVRLARSDDLDGDHESTRGVVLHGVASHRRAVLGVSGWDRTPGLVLGLGSSRWTARR